MTPEEVGPNAWHQVVHPDDLPAAVARREQTLRSGETFEVEYRFRGADGRYRWHLGRAVPMRDADGAASSSGSGPRPTSTTASSSRSSARSSSPPATRSRARSTTARRLRQVAELAAGDIADWCSVHVVEPDGTIVELAVAHADPAKVTFARELQERYPPDPDAPTGAPAVIRTGEPELVPEITDEMLADRGRRRAAPRSPAAARALVVHVRAAEGPRRACSARSRSSRRSPAATSERTI